MKIIKAKIRITSCASCYFWYKKQVGSEFNVVAADNDKYDYWIAGLDGQAFIRKKDCEVLEPEEEQGETVRYMHNVLCEMDERIKALEVKEGYLNFDKRFVAFEEKVKILEETSPFIKSNETAIQELRDLIGTPYVWPDKLAKLEAQKRAAGLACINLPTKPL